MKKLINNPDDVVSEALLGMASAHPQLRVDHQQRVVYRGEPTRPGKVAIISGGGSGHEPLHAGFVGLGMLDAACAGEVFTSPVPDQMLAATIAVDAGAGVLHVVKNYTGDVMNFDMAAELAAAQTGVRVVSVVTDDDVAVQDSTWTAGRRGVGATVLLEKIAGAAAEQGRSLDEVAEVARAVNARSRSMGVALTACTVPAVGKPTFELGPDEIELGVGIHGEPGRERIAMAPAADIAAMLVDPVVEDLGLARGDQVIAFVNGLGGTPLLELYIMFNEVHGLLAGRGITITRSLVGSFITSLDMAGASVTLLKADDETLGLWDAPVNTTALRWGDLIVTAPAPDTLTVSDAERWVRAFADLISENRSLLTDLDAAIGDADHGSNMHRGMQAVVASLADSPADAYPTVGPMLTKVGMTLVSTVGGASGPLFGTLFLRLGASLKDSAAASVSDLATAFAAGLAGVVERGKAGPGDKTMYEALAPAVEALQSAADSGASLTDALALAQEAAARGRDATIPLRARKGRASYLGERSVGHQDPGATSVQLLFAAATASLAHDR